MAKMNSAKSTVAGRKAAARAPRESTSHSAIRFCATLHRPRAEGKALATDGTQKAVSRRGKSESTVSGETWAFLNLPMEASAKLPSRGQVTVEGTFNGAPFLATLSPDGNGGHWLRVDQTLCNEARAAVGDTITIEIMPVTVEPEPVVPDDLRKALAAAPAKARESWSDITPAARRDFIHWITSGKRAETRAKRIDTACDMLAKGKRRPCCFDRSGMYDKSLGCPVAADELDD